MSKLTELKIEQKKFSIRHTFTFEPQQLNFAWDNRAGSGDIDVSYGDIPKKSQIRIDENSWLRNVGILWCGLGGLGVLIGWSGLIWLPIGLACLGWYRYSKVKYTVFESEHGSIWILHDRRCDEIVSEILKRRNEQLRAWYGEVNPDNGVENEVRKFMWLGEQGVLSKEETELKIAQVQQLRAHGASDGILN